MATRTRLINDLRWNLHDLWPELEIPPRGLIAVHWPERIAGRLARAEQTTRVRIARDELRRIRDLTRTIDELERRAESLGVAGWARNRLDGTVEVWAEGRRDVVEALLDYCRKGPPGAAVECLTVDEVTPAGLGDFVVQLDRAGVKRSGGGV